jgi:hypothetical protein
MNTKKLLVASDADTGETSNDFLVVLLESEQEPKLFGLKSRKSFSSGVVAYIGMEITENDLFARLVDAGRYIADVDHTLGVLETYIQKLQEFRIGNVLTITGDALSGFRLVKLADTPPRTDPERRLP